jgi:hypothetical protein
MLCVVLTTGIIQTIVNLCMALGFLVRSCCTICPMCAAQLFGQAHGYATHEFEVTEDRLAVYLPASLYLSCFMIVMFIHIVSVLSDRAY